MIVLISHLLVPIEWVPYPQKQCWYCRMTPQIFVMLYLEFEGDVKDIPDTFLVKPQVQYLVCKQSIALQSYNLS